MITFITRTKYRLAVALVTAPIHRSAFALPNASMYSPKAATVIGASSWHAVRRTRDTTSQTHLRVW